MIKRILTIIFILTSSISIVFADGNNSLSYFKNKAYYKKPNPNLDYISTSKYDFSDFANSLTKGCSNDYEKIEAIYSWICDNIEYDTSYEIYTADECIEERKGVCQAYCDLFYHLAKAVDVRVEVVDGESKDYYGRIGKTGHAWIFAYVDEYYGILLDPTWGAGSVDGNRFIKNKDCWIWFGVDPKWMILSHFPSKEEYQLLDNHITRAQFVSMKTAMSIWLEYGLKVDDIYEMIINDELSLPTFFGDGEGLIRLLDIPMQESLKIGNNYTLRVKLLSEKDIAIINSNIYITKEKWQYESDGIFSINFMPQATGKLSFNIKDEFENVWHTMIEYNIDEPTQNDWDRMKSQYPLSSPDVKNVRNLYDKEWADAGIDNVRLAKLIENNNVKALPTFYTDKGKLLKIVKVPMNEKLTEGQTYTFSFYPRCSGKWAIVNNDIWHKEWNISEDGKLSMTIKPSKGELVLYVQMADGENYSGCLGYEVW